MDDDELAEIRKRDKAEIPRLLPPDGNDPYLRAAMDRRALLAVVDEVRAVTAIAEDQADVVGPPTGYARPAVTTTTLRQIVGPE